MRGRNRKTVTRGAIGGHIISTTVSRGYTAPDYGQIYAQAVREGWIEGAPPFPHNIKLTRQDVTVEKPGKKVVVDLDGRTEEIAEDVCNRAYRLWANENLEFMLSFECEFDAVRFKLAYSN